MYNMVVNPTTDRTSTRSDLPQMKSLMNKIATTMFAIMIAFLGVMNQEAEAQKVNTFPGGPLGGINFTIEDADDLIMLNGWVTGAATGVPINCAGITFTVMNDIVADPNTMIGDDWTSFEGNFVGDCRKITVDLNYQATTQNVGLFSIIGGNATIEGLIIDGKVNAMGQNTGALAGQVMVISNFEHLVNLANVTGVGNVGGFVGQVMGANNFEHLVNFAKVTGSMIAPTNVGGIAGLVNASGPVNFIECHNNGSVTGSLNIGGLVGLASDIMDLLYFERGRNSGTLSSSSSHSMPYSIGGIIGASFRPVKLYACVNIGCLFSKNVQRAGGLAGNLLMGEVFNSVNSGVVDGATEYVGGIIGFISISVMVDECINTNWVDRGTAPNFGAIVGFSNSLISTCYYDNQMTIIWGMPPPVTTPQGIPTLNMIGSSLASSLVGQWVFEDGLYPRPSPGLSGGNNSVDLLAAAPIFLANGQNVSNVRSNFNVSQNVTNPHPFQWGRFNNPSNPCNYLPVSVVGHIHINNPTAFDATILGTGQDSLVVRLECNSIEQMHCNSKILSYKIFEKWVPVNVTVCFDTILANTDGNGQIEPSGNVIVPCNKDTTFYFEPNFCHEVDEVIVDDVVVNDYVVGSNEYTVYANKGIKHIRVTFKKSKFEVLGIVTSTDEKGDPIGGTIEPTIDSVLCDDSVKFVIKPDYCYEVESILVNDDSVKNVSNVSLNPFWVYNVTEPLKVEVAFKKIKYTISASVKGGTGGTITPPGDTLVNCGDTITYTFTPDSCYVVDKVIVNDKQVPYDTAKSSYTFNGVYGNQTIEVKFKKDTNCTDTCIYTLVEVYRAYGASEKTNASTIIFEIVIVPAPPQPYLIASDFEVSFGLPVTLPQPPNSPNLMRFGIYYIDVDVSSLDSCHNIVELVRIKDCWLKNTVVNPNEFYDVRRKFCDTAILTNPPCASIAPLDMQGAEITFNEFIDNHNLTNTSIQFRNQGNPTNIVFGDNPVITSPIITFNYTGLLADTWYDVYILPNTVRDAWRNPNPDTIFLCSIKTEPDKPCIYSIMRYDPTDYKTNADTLIFIITFSDDVIIDENDVFVSYISFSGGGYKIEDVYAGNNNSIWFVKVSVDSNTTYKAGDTVRIDSIAGYVFCDTNNITNEDYNVRHKFLADIITTTDKGPQPSASSPTTLILRFEDSDAVTGDLELPFMPLIRQSPYESNGFTYTDYESAFVLYLGVGQFVTGLHSTKRIATDTWGNDSILNNTNGEVEWNFTVMPKVNMAGGLVSKSPFVISNIHPNPTDDEAEFTISILEEGNLSVDIYDLSGSFIMNVIADKFLNANTELRIPLSLGNLSSGVYTIMISMDNNIMIMMQQIIIVK